MNGILSMMKIPREPCKEINNIHTSLQKANNILQHAISEKTGSLYQVLETCRRLLNKMGVHSTTTMIAAGFSYTVCGDTMFVN